jgi:signal transduction histidine kinase
MGVTRAANLKLVHKGLILISVPLIFELAFVVALTWLLQQADYQAWRQAHVRTLVSEATVVNELIYKAGEALLAYGLTKSENSANSYNKAVDRVSEQLRFLKTLTIDDPRQKELLDGIDRFANNALEIFGRGSAAIEHANEGSDFGSYVPLKVELNENMKQLLAEVDKFSEEEGKFESLDPQAEEKARALVGTCIVFGVVFNIVVALALAVFFSRDIAGRLRTVVDNAGKVTRDQTLNPVLAGTDEIAHLDHVFHDMADTLAEASRKRLELENLKQQFVAMISHDLRTPLTAIKSYFSLLSDGTYGQLTERGVQRSKLAETSVQSLISMVSDLLDVEKFEAGKLEMNCQNTSLQAIVDKSLDAVRGMAEQQKVKLEARDVATEVYADADRLVRVLVNLLGNAIKFSPADSTVSISSTVTNGWVEVRVVDQGRGIPAAHKEAIFDRFQQVEIEDDTSKGGSGLGLAICKAIVEAHGGTIGVDSEEGKGSTFWFRCQSRRVALPP